MTIGPAELQTLWVSCYMFQIYPLQEGMGNCSYFPNRGPACTIERLMICNGSAYDHVSRYMSFNSVLTFLTQYENIMAGDIPGSASAKILKSDFGLKSNSLPLKLLRLVT